MRVLGGDHRVGHAEARVRSGGEDAQCLLGPALDGQVELCALGAADPIALHHLHALGPVEAVELGQQLVGVRGDLEEPLLEVALFHDVAGALTRPVGEHLLVGQDGLAARTPVDRGVGPVREAGLQELQEDDLVPVDVRRVVAAHLPAPVVDRTEAGDRLLQLGDAGLGELAGVRPGPDRGVLCGQAERVEPHR